MMESRIKLANIKSLKYLVEVIYRYVSGSSYENILLITYYSAIKNMLN